MGLAAMLLDVCACRLVASPVEASGAAHPSELFASPPSPPSWCAPGYAKVKHHLGPRHRNTTVWHAQLGRGAQHRVCSKDSERLIP